MRSVLSTGFAAGRKTLVAVAGSAVLLLGLVMIVLPGPAIAVIPIGLGILATEFEWARRWLQHVRERARRLAERLRRPPSTAL